MNASRLRIRDRRGFTLVELLVVITIIGLISVAAIRGGLLNARSDYKAGEAARQLQGGLAGTRDAAIRANAPRGLRFLPDPILSPPPYGNAQPGILASNRFVTIEPAPDYHEGMILAVPVTIIAGSPPPFLQVKQAPFSTVSGVPIPNDPTGWTYNIRQGDKIRFNDSGAYYTIAGPMQVGPSYSGATVLQNSERYINAPLVLLDPSQPLSATNPLVEFLSLVNGVDDDNDGWVDEGFDGIDNDGDGIVDPGYNGVDDAGFVKDPVTGNIIAYPKNGIIDEPMELLIGSQNGANEFEQEVFVGNPPSSANPSNYTIVRKPIISPGARETTLPDGMVIDMTTWNAPSATPFSKIGPNGQFPNGPIQFPERSRLPVDPYSYYVDIMVAPSGQIVQSGAGSAGIEYNSISPTSNLPFYHFWLTERQGVVAPLWTPISTPKPFIPGLNPSYPNQNNLLPMPKGTPNYAPSANQSPQFLTGERRLVTLFTRSGLIVTNSIEIFDGNDINRPFYDAQAGIKESQ